MSIIFAYETARACYRLAAADLICTPRATSVDPLSDARGGLRHLQSCQDAPLTLSIGELMLKGIYPLLEPFRLNRSIPDHELSELKAHLACADDIGFSIDLPCRVLVSPLAQRGKTTCHAVRAHICSVPLPPSSFRRIGQSAYVPSPELLFLEMARRDVRAHALATFGCELCGCYSLLPRGLASVRKLLGIRRINAPS